MNLPMTEAAVVFEVLLAQIVRDHHDVVAIG